MPHKSGIRAAMAVALGGLSLSAAVAAEDGTFSEYRDMFGDANPAVFVIDEGASIWAEARGPNKVSLEQCDLGLGPGVVEGAYAQLPRYFEDADRVMDLETRLIYCMVELQGFDRAEITADPYSGRGETDTTLEALAAYVASESEGKTIDIPQSHPAEKQAYKAGEALFWHRAGPYDFACATCHRQDGKRVRLQDLPNLTTADGARSSYPDWPAYRISQGVVRTMEWRMRNCMRQQRLPMLKVGSEAAVNIITYMGVNANGGTMAAPGLKR